MNNRRHLLYGLGAALAASALPSTGLALGPSGRQPRPAPFTNIPYATWDDSEPDYLLYPGDEIEVATPTAPELTRTVKVGPDGRIALPLIGQVMAADRSISELDQVLSQAYATQLVRPVVEITLKASGPLKVFVGGEVGTPGVFDMPGDIDALQAVIMAGGMKPSAKSGKVVVIRRGPGGRPMVRTIDLGKAQEGRGEAPVPLRRFDVIFVPRSSLAEIGRFMTSLREALPVSFSYNLGNAYVY
ncbi:MAG: polysaccharide export protein [Caulobacteraceae bacterium]|nr:polysaccharide export protein [Caulobacteraceae bacterium]